MLRLILIDDGSVFLNIMSELNVIWGRLAISDCIFPVFSLSCATQILATVIFIKIDICFEDEASVVVERHVG